MGANLEEQIEKAFDYRGDTTIFLRSGERIEGFVFNRQFGENGFIEILLPTDGERKKIDLSELVAIDLSGEDCAAGKSYQEWLDKQKASQTKGEAL